MPLRMTLSRILASINNMVSDSTICTGFLLTMTVDTGEEGEEVHFSSRARLYFFDGSWKERGTGVIKVNIRTPGDEDTESREPDPEAQAMGGRRKARLLMRADATHKVLLNSPVFKGMKFGAPDGSEPTGKLMHVQSLENGKPLLLQIKVSASASTSYFY